MRRPRDFGRAMLKGMTLGAADCSSIVAQRYGRPGQVYNLFHEPSYCSIRYINIGDVPDPVEIVYAHDP